MKNDTQSELLDCPFCGSKTPDLDSIEGHTGTQHFVSCDSEDCIAYMHQPWLLLATKKEACAAWNTRTQTPPASTVMGESRKWAIIFDIMTSEPLHADEAWAIKAADLIRDALSAATAKPDWRDELLQEIKLHVTSADGWEDGETFYKGAVEHIRDALKGVPTAKSSLSIKHQYSHIVDFIKRWENPPASDDPKSLDMISDFMLCLGSEAKPNLVGGENVSELIEELKHAEGLAAPHPTIEGKEASLHREGLLLDAFYALERLSGAWPPLTKPSPSGTAGENDVRGMTCCDKGRIGDGHACYAEALTKATAKSEVE